MVSLEEDQCVKNWKSRIGPSFPIMFRHLKRFYADVLTKHHIFKDMTFEQIVNWHSKTTGREDPYLIKKLAQEYIDAMPDMRLSSKIAFLSHISSPFLHNHAPLPLDRSFHFDSRKVKPPVDGKLKVNSFKQILHTCNVQDRAMLTLMAATFMGCGEMVHVNTQYAKQIFEGVTRDVGWIKLVLPGRKQTRNKKNFYTLFNTRSDAGTALSQYFDQCAKPPTDVLFRNTPKKWGLKGNPVTEKNIRRRFHKRSVDVGLIREVTPKCRSCGAPTLRKRKQKDGKRKVSYLCKECGKNTRASEVNFDFRGVRYGVNPHEIRDLMRSRWQVSGADPLVAEFLMGHEVDKNAYVKFMDYEPNYVVQEYRKALPWLNVLSEEPDKISRDEIGSRLDERDAEIDALRSELAEMKRRQGEVMVLLDRLPLNKEMQKALRKK